MIPIKRDILWNNIIKTKYDIEDMEKHKPIDFPLIADNLSNHVFISLNKSDEIPENLKKSHRYGTTALCHIEFNENGKNKYTGLMKENKIYCLIRLSYGTLNYLRNEDIKDKLYRWKTSLSCGIKVFLNDGETTNLLFLSNNQNDLEKENYFDEILTTDVNKSGNIPPTFMRVSTDFKRIVLDEFCSFDIDGNKLSQKNIIKPEILNLYPSDTFKNLYYEYKKLYNGKNIHDFRKILQDDEIKKKVNIGTKIYDIYDEQYITVGSIYLDSEFVSSLYSDTQLHFNHVLSKVTGKPQDQLYERYGIYQKDVCIHVMDISNIIVYPISFMISLYDFFIYMPLPLILRPFVLIFYMIINLFGIKIFTISTWNSRFLLLENEIYRKSYIESLRTFSSKEDYLTSKTNEKMYAILNDDLIELKIIVDYIISMKIIKYFKIDVKIEEYFSKLFYGVRRYVEYDLKLISMYPNFIIKILKNIIYYNMLFNYYLGKIIRFYPINTHQNYITKRSIGDNFIYNLTNEIHTIKIDQNGNYY